MSHHHTAALLAASAGVWISMLTCYAGGAFAIFAGLRSAKRRPSAMEFAIQSARRIRTRPIH